MNPEQARIINSHRPKKNQPPIKLNYFDRRYTPPACLFTGIQAIECNPFFGTAGIGFELLKSSLMTQPAR